MILDFVIQYSDLQTKKQHKNTFCNRYDNTTDFDSVLASNAKGSEFESIYYIFRWDNSIPTSIL